MNLLRHILCIFLLSAGHAVAQVPWGIGVEEETHELSIKDDSSGLYYSAYPLQFNKGFVFGCHIITSSFSPQIRLIDAQNKIVHEASGQLTGDTGYSLVTHTVVPADGIYTLVVAASSPGVKGEYQLTEYLFQPVQFEYRATYNFCERLAFLFNHAAAEFRFLDTLGRGRVKALLADSSAAYVTAGNYTNIICRTRDTNQAPVFYNSCLANLRACLGADYWAEKQSENTTEGNETIRMSSEFSLKPAYGKGAVFRLVWWVNAASGIQQVEIRARK